MRRLLILGAALTSATTAAATDLPRFSNFTYEGRTQEQARALPGEYLNPILSGYYPDPSVTRVGDEYYLALSSFAHFPGLPIFRSKDLVNWTQIGNAIDRPGQLDFTGMGTSRAVFAPDISFHAGTFYIAGTCVDCGGNFVITAKDAAGPWSDPIWLPFEGIDPSIYWEGDRAYIVNNRAPAEPPRYEGHRAIWLQEFDWRAGKMVGESVQLVNGGVDITKQPVWIEGPHILRREGWYYLTAAEGGTSVNHSQVVLRSKALRGPYRPFAGNPILTQRDLDPARPHPVTSTGHAKLVQTQRGDWWATFLGVRPYESDYYNIGRETFLLPVTWKDGWPIILPKDKPVPFTAPRPNLPRQPQAATPTSGDFSYVDEFDGKKLGLAWIGIRTPKAPLYQLRAGELVLNSGTRLGDLSGAPGYVARRLQHHVATVATTVRFSPDKDGERAGLAAVQSDRNHLFFGVTRLGGRTSIALYTSDDGKEQLVASTPVASGTPVTLTIHADAGTMRVQYKVGGETKTLASDVDTRFLSTKVAGGFVGTLIGPYSWVAPSS
ncbi:glycoside hydrolase family 43 protein [Sphingomonas sp. IC-56]|uniref:glycoside hydrolase family 43 protein n=1 Tax=Sphingomonas sp. IC-56 TaxID=2898529 RepID=UPI001E5199A2|nr:glycoside hydrolase family 43 protein [Sphingomonas sp. IC-56]MCD2324866.1 glycoside hydrolase family 43 protein [Sphingomonas sp. IC-56]